MKSKFANLNLGEINVLSAEQKKGVTGGAYGSGGGSGPSWPGFWNTLCQGGHSWAC